MYLPHCLRLAFACPLLAAAVVVAPAQTPDLRALISQADLHYSAPVPRSEEGLPVGNGRMGSLVWTSPTALKFQINRVDIQSINRDTNSFFERNSDYMGGAGFVDIELGGAGADVFPAENAPQHLNVYDALASLNGHGITARVLAWHAQDVIAVELDDQRAQPEPLQVNLRMLRHASQYWGQIEPMIKDRMVTVRTRNHTAASQLSVHGDRIVLTQEFREGDHFAKSAVAIAFTGRAAKPRYADETEVRLVAPAAKGRAVVFISTAATLDPAEDVVATALQQLDAAAAKEFAGLARENATWWHDFWALGYIDIKSADGTAQYVASNYHYYLYLMAATSRGKYPPKFNGMIWNTAGDLRTWGVQHWFANLSCYYEALYAANRLELLEPVYKMYFGMYDAAATAARQQWGSQGIFIPETVWFDGLATLPDDIAAEMRELYLMRKPWDQRSTRFMEFAQTKLPHSSRWNFFGGGSWIDGRWVPTERGHGPFGPVTHILGTTGKVAYLFWRHYEYTLDQSFLQTRAYPMLKGAAEFYRHFPNLKKGDDGKYHIHHVNSNESVMDARDSDEDLSAMRGVFAAAIRAAEILDQDAQLRTAWAEILNNLAPLPTSADPDAIRKPDYETEAPVFVRARQPVVQGRGLLPDGNSLPMWFFDLCHVETADKERLAVANATFAATYRRGITEETPVGVLSKWAIGGASLGHEDAVRYLVPNQMRSLAAERPAAYRGGKVLANRMALREGHQALDAQRLGRASEALQLGLLLSNPPAPAEAPIIHLFAAWPAEWEANFTLRARGGFVVTAAQKSGRAEFVELLSEAGAPCRLRNPWGDAEVVIERSGGGTQRVSGSLLTFPTTRGERLRLTPAR